MSYGRFLEDFQPGTTFRHEPARTISGLDIELIRWLATGRAEPLPGGAETKPASPQDHEPVPLWLLVSLCIGMSGRDISARALGNRYLRDVVMHREIGTGTTVRCQTTVDEVAGPDDIVTTAAGRAGLVTVTSWLEDQAGVRVLSLRRAVLIPARGGWA